jgi:hypothetical protein
MRTLCVKHLCLTGLWLSILLSCERIHDNLGTQVVFAKEAGVRLSRLNFTFEETVNLDPVLISSDYVSDEQDILVSREVYNKWIESRVWQTVRTGAASNHLLNELQSADRGAEWRNFRSEKTAFDTTTFRSPDVILIMPPSLDTGAAAAYKVWKDAGMVMGCFARDCGAGLSQEWIPTKHWLAKNQALAELIYKEYQKLTNSKI